jgi:hypothetical protein
MPLLGITINPVRSHIMPEDTLDPERQAAIEQVLAELARAERLFPGWPTDPLHALAVLGEEFGELSQAVLQEVYEPHKNNPCQVRAEAVQTAAMALRFLIGLAAYEYKKAPQVYPWGTVRERMGK